MSQESEVQKDRREFKRIATTAIVEVTPASSEENLDQITAETLDLSPGGVLFCSDVRFDVGSLWRLKILLEESQKLNADWELKNFDVEEPAVSAVCRVVRVHGAEEIGYEIAVQFESIESDDIEEVKKFLKEV